MISYPDPNLPSHQTPPTGDPFDPNFADHLCPPAPCACTHTTVLPPDPCHSPAPGRCNCVIMEVGAGAGATVLRWLARLDPANGGKFIAFEPDPGSPVHACTHPALWLHDCALGAVEDRLLLRRPGPSSDLSHIASDPVHPAHLHVHKNDVVVRCAALDDLYDSSTLPRLNLLRLDCNGFEVFALAGARHTLMRLRPVVVIRLDPAQCALYGSSPLEAISLLLSLGYDLSPRDGCEWIARPIDQTCTNTP